jgi:hypothetical protein
MLHSLKTLSVRKIINRSFGRRDINAEASLLDYSCKGRNTEGRDSEEKGNKI